MKIQHIHGLPPLYTNTFLITTDAGHGILIDAAAGHIGTPAGASKQRITTEKQVTTVQHHTALGMAGGVIDFKC